MASPWRMLRWKDEPHAADSELKAFLETLCEKRGTASWYDRFEPAELRIGDRRLHIDFIDVGPERPTLVFAPGTNAYGLLYGQLLAALADSGVNAVTFDPRGHGRSSGARGSYTIAEVVDDLRAVCRWAKQRFAGPLYAAGSSQGGIAAFYLAAEPTSGALLAGAICHNLADLARADSVRLTRMPWLSRLAKPLLPSLARLLPELPVPMSVYLDLRREPVRGVGHAAEVLHADPLTVPFVRLKTLASLSHTPLPQPIERIETPLLILHAGADTIFPSDYVGALFEQLTCDKALRLYPDLPHYIVVDYVERIAGDVLSWIERGDAPSDTPRDDTPSDTTRDDTPSDTTRDDTPSDTTRDDTPSDTTRGDAPSDTPRDDAPSDTSPDELTS